MMTLSISVELIHCCYTVMIKDHTISSYEAQVDRELESFLINNLKLVKTPDSIKHYIVSNKIGRCRRFAYCASNGDKWTTQN